MENIADNMKSVRILSYSYTVTVWNICFLVEEFSDTPRISEFIVFSDLVSIIKYSTNCLFNDILKESESRSVVSESLRPHGL